MKNHPFFSSLLLAAVLGAVTGCATSPSAVNADPQAFMKDTFTISGKVEQSLTLPGTTVTAFLLGDGQSTLVALSVNQKKTGEQVTFQARLLGLASGPAPLGTEEKQLIRTILIKNKIVNEGFADLTVGAIEAAISSLGTAAKKLYLLLES